MTAHFPSLNWYRHFNKKKCGGGSFLTFLQYIWVGHLVLQTISNQRILTFVNRINFSNKVNIPEVDLSIFFKVGP
jgi:hypothetical protein